MFPSVRSAVLAVALAVVPLSAAPAGAFADTILVGAPVWNNSSAWVSQSGVPPTGLVFNHAVEFALSSAQQVTSIHVSLYGSADVSPAPFTFALVDSLTSGSPLYSANLVAPSDNTTTDYALPVNAVLPAGTYFIRLTTTGFIGWLVADATQFVTTAGTIADGIWQQSPTTGNWTFQGSGGNTALGFPHPGVFSVLGPDDETAIPAPASVALTAVGLGLLTLRRPTLRRI